MFKETSIFDCEYRVDQRRRNLAKAQYFAFSGFGSHIGRQDLGFERERIEQSAITANLRDLIYSKRHAHDLFRSSGPDLKVCIDKTKTSTPNVARICFDITSTTQNYDKLFSRQLLPGLEHARSGVESGLAGQITTGESRIDD